MLSTNQIVKSAMLADLLSRSVKPLSRARMLAFVYCVDEQSFQIIGKQPFKFDYHVWEVGPVATDLFLYLDQSNFKNREFFEIEVLPTGITNIKSKIDYDSDEFGVVGDVISKMMLDQRFANPVRLRKYLRRSTGPWYKTIVENNLMPDLLLERVPPTKYKISFEKSV